MSPAVWIPALWCGASLPAALFIARVIRLRDRRTPRPRPSLYLVPPLDDEKREVAS